MHFEYSVTALSCFSTAALAARREASSRTASCFMRVSTVSSVTWSWCRIPSSTKFLPVPIFIHGGTLPVAAQAGQTRPLLKGFFALAWSRPRASSSPVARKSNARAATLPIATASFEAAP